MKSPVERIVNQETKSTGNILKVKKPKRKYRKNIDSIKSTEGNNISKKTNDSLVSISSVKHRRCSGIDNWKKFLETQGMNLTLQKKKSTNNVLNGERPGSKSIKITKVVGMDCEMVGIGEKGLENMLARVSLVNNFGDCIYDKYVKPREKVTDYRTYVSGIRPEDIKDAEEFEVVQKEVADILKNRILVGHAIKNDLDVLFLTHPKYAIRDTARFFCKKNRRTPSLKSLAFEYLQANIQDGEHNSIQDAQAAMHLYNMYRKQWESGKGNKYRRRIECCGSENKPIPNTTTEVI